MMRILGTYIFSRWQCSCRCEGLIAPSSGWGLIKWLQRVFPKSIICIWLDRMNLIFDSSYFFTLLTMWSLIWLLAPPVAVFQEGVLDWGSTSATSASASALELLIAYTCYVISASHLVLCTIGLGEFHPYNCSEVAIPSCPVCWQCVFDLYLWNTITPIWLKFTSKMLFGIAMDWLDFDYWISIGVAMVVISNLCLPCIFL